MPQYELDVRDYIRIFNRRKYIILFIFVAVTISSKFMTPKPSPPVYEAINTVKIEERKTIAGILTEEVSMNPADRLESETKFITSYPIMKDSAVRLGRIGADSSIEDVNAAIGDLQGSISTKRVENTNMISIIATSGNPSDAMTMANTVAEAYINDNLMGKNRQARQTRQFITDQLSSLGGRLKSGEERLKRLAPMVKTVSPEMAAFKAPEMRNPLQDKLVELQFQLAGLLQKYTEKHPQVIDVREQIKFLEAELEAQFKKSYAGSDPKGASQALNDDDPEAAKAKFSRELEYMRLSREVEIDRKLYGMLKEKLAEARITEAQVVSDISVVNPAILPESPISGGGVPLNTTLVGAIMGVVLGLAIAFIMETMDTSISTIEDVERVVKLPVLGIIPSVEHEFRKRKGTLSILKDRLLGSSNKEEEGRFARLVSYFMPQSNTTEAFRHIYTNLKMSAGNKKTLMITSSGPREGKSSIVCNLGIVTSQLGLKTVIVSTDLRRPVISKTFGVDREPGIGEVIKGSASLDQSLHSVTDFLLGDMNLEDIRANPGIENLSILPSGHSIDNPVKLLESAEFQKLVADLRKKFDIVIFDSPPILLVTDTSVMAPFMDCVVIVHEVGRTSREAVLRAKMQLESMGAKTAGIILNHISRQTQAVVSYPYYGYSKERYADDPGDKKGAKSGKS